MATEYFNDAWRIPNNKNQSNFVNYSGDTDGTGGSTASACIIESPDFMNGALKLTFNFWIRFDDIITDTSYRDGLIHQVGTDTTYFRFYNWAGDNLYCIHVQNGVSIGTFRVEDFRETYAPIGEWIMLTLVWDGTKAANKRFELFKNDNSTNIFTITPNANKTTWLNGANSTISTGQGATTYQLNGAISTFNIYNDALDTSQIADLYGDGTAVINPMSLSFKPKNSYTLGQNNASNNTTEPNPPVQSYLVPNNSLQDYVFQTSPAGSPHISIPSITISEAATISIWVNIISFSGGTQQTFFGDQTNTKLVVNNQSGVIRVIYSGESGLGTLTTSLVTSDFINKWHHIALVQNGGAATVYIDNINEENITGTLRTPSFAAIGALAGGAATLNGFVSNAAIFSINLPPTGTESIASLYNNGTPPDLSSYSNLERWYKLNAQDTFDGTNWTIKDYANNQDGTSVRMTSANLVQSNLQHTSGYSPYALDFGGITAHLKTYTIPATTNTVTLSAWVKRTGASGQYAGVFGVRNSGGTPSFGLCWQISFGNNDNKIRFRTSADSSSGWQEVVQNDVMPDNTWHHVAGVADGTNLKIYINGALQTDTKTQTNGTLQSPTSNIFFGMQSAASSPFNGQLSNCARWNIGLTQAQVTEIYNQGVPSNLNNFSGTTPIGWWQLGSNSSFEGNDWTCLDEIGTDYADSGTTAMTEDDIVNGVGYSGNGLGTSSIEIVGDAPYSTANGLSENMDVLDRTTDVPS